MRSSSASFRVLTLVSALLCLAACGGGVGAVEKAKPAPAKQAEPAQVATDGRPASVPARYIATPNGYFDPSCIVHVAADEKVQADLTIKGPRGLRAATACEGTPRYDRKGALIASTSASQKTQGKAVTGNSPPPTVAHDWVSYVFNENHPPVAYMYAQWRVPAAPWVQTHQTLFYFPGLQQVGASSAANTIIQPVLGWNADFPHAWGIASWNCCNAGTTVEGPAMRVNPGDLIQGWMVGDSCGANGVCANWTIVTLDATTGAQSTLYTSSLGQRFDWMVGNALEVYNIDGCMQYSPTGSVAMEGIYATNTSGAYITPAWEDWASAENPSCQSTAMAPNSTTAIVTAQPLTLAPMPSMAQTADTTLWELTPSAPYGTGLGMMPGTSPSITTLNSGAHYYAFQANTTRLFVNGGDTGLGMMPGTSPSITGLANGGFQVAFQANTGHLWVYGSLGTGDTGLGMAPGTSPSIKSVNSSYMVAFTANTNNLWIYGAYGTGDLGLGMMGGTSPSVTGLWTGGYQIAFEANTGNLWVAGSLGTGDTGYGMMGGTSPAIAAIYPSGYQVAFQANTSYLWVYGTLGSGPTGLGMGPGTSPAIAPDGFGYEVAFHAAGDELWYYGSAGTFDTALPLAPGTNPSITW